MHQIFFYYKFMLILEIINDFIHSGTKIYFHFSYKLVAVWFSSKILIVCWSITLGDGEMAHQSRRYVTLPEEEYPDSVPSIHMVAHNPL